MELTATTSKSRYGRGWVLAATAHIRKLPKTTQAQLWKIESQSVPGKYYNVIEKSNGDITCDCPDYDNRQDTCKHIFAVIIREAA